MKFYLSILLAAIAIFFWGFFVWALGAERFGIFQRLPPDSGVVKGLPTGNYVSPFADSTIGMTEDEKVAAQKSMEEKMKAGPVIRVVVNTEGRSMLDTMKLGFLHMLLAAAIVATLTRCVLSWADFKARYAFIVAVGAFAAIWVDLSPAIWMGAPWNYQLYTAGYDLGAWILAGLPIAWGTARGPV